MEPTKYRLSSLSRESLMLPEEEEDTNSFRNNNKAKQTRKTSTTSLRDDGKTKIRPSKGRQSLPLTTEEMSDALSFPQTNDLKSNNNDHLSTCNELEAEEDDNNDEDAPDLTELTLDEEDEGECLQASGATKSRQNEYSTNGMSLTAQTIASWSREGERKNVVLEKRLANDNEFVVTGIMNLSAMNLTDNDVPMIIQRAFWGGRKKCIGLILRDNCLTSDGVRMIVDAILAARTLLRYLSFSNNTDIGDAGIEHIVRLLQKNRSIIFLALPRIGMTDHGVRLLADVLCGVDADSPSHSRSPSPSPSPSSSPPPPPAPPPPPPPPLQKLYISFNKLITDESLDAILQILEHNRTLKVFSCEHCSLSDKARKRLRQASSKKKKKKFSLSE